METVSGLLEVLGVVVLAVAGSFSGYLISKLRKPWWILGYFIPLILLIVITLCRRIPEMGFVAPFSWIMAGRFEFVLFGPVISMLLTTPLSRLEGEVKKVLVVSLMGFAVLFLSVLPFLLPVLMRSYHEKLETVVDTEGVCLQSNGFNCGPASAVTALKMLGIEAEEGELAVLAYTSPVAGTPPDLLCDALTQKYAEHGLKCRYRSFGSLSELKNTEGVIIAVIKFSFLIDHYITVMEITDEHVIVGDPLKGKHSYTHDEFSEKWRRAGIVITRNAH
ncbi:MAG: hypothetical protein E3J72_11630 [Planctomycetota bacterium]|nr:MAG: hypothetical protein E3J72_11630 [Planctomycetota bacterium]